MAIFVKTPREIDVMRRAGAIVQETLELLKGVIRAGVTTKDLDRIAAEFLRSKGAAASFKGYNGYPASICVSVEDEVVHGVPSKRALADGQIVSIDVGAYIDGYHADAARTFIVGGSTDPMRTRLVKVTEESFFEACKVIKDGVRVGDISHAIQSHCEAHGYSVVRALVGHGIGRQMHEDPSVPNFGKAGRGIRLTAGMTVAVEPMVNMGEYEVTFDADGWTVRTKDGKPSAHYENTVLVTKTGYELLTL